jgi:lipopolysaccharide export system permease protein
MHELIYPDLQQEWEQRNRVKMIAEFHSRLSSPLYNLAFMAMALNAVIGGAFSRLGYGRRIAMIAGVAAFVRILGFAVQAACDDNAALNLLQYSVPLIATWWALAQIFRQKSSRTGGLRLLGARKPDVEWIT